MQDAFRKAFQDLPPRSSYWEPNSFEQLRATAGDPVPAGRVAEGADQTRLGYHLQKLAHHWCGYAHPGGPTPARRARLQDEWLPLAGHLGALPPAQRVELLDGLARELGANLKQPQQRYLRWEAATHPEYFQGLSAIPGVVWLSPTAMFVHALEELEDCSAEERQQWHQHLRMVAPSTSEARPRWLLEQLSAWLAARRQSPAD